MNSLGNTFSINNIDIFVIIIICLLLLTSRLSQVYYYSKWTMASAHLAGSSLDSPLAIFLYLSAFCASVGPVVGPPGASSWASFWLSWGLPGAHFGSPGDLLGLSWGSLVPSGSGNHRASAQLSANQPKLGPNLAQFGPKLGPSWLQVGPSAPQMGPRRLKLAQVGLKLQVLIISWTHGTSKIVLSLK